MRRMFMSAAVAASAMLFGAGAGSMAITPFAIEKAAAPTRTVRHVRPSRSLRGRGKTYRFKGIQERARRVRQIQSGQLTTANGLVLAAG